MVEGCAGCGGVGCVCVSSGICDDYRVVRGIVLCLSSLCFFVILFFR